MEFTWENLVAFLRFIDDDCYLDEDRKSNSVSIDGNIYQKQLEKFVQSTTKEDV